MAPCLLLLLSDDGMHLLLPDAAVLPKRLVSALKARDDTA